MKRTIVKKSRYRLNKNSKLSKGILTGAVGLGTWIVSTKVANADEVATPTTSSVDTSVNATGKASEGDGLNVTVPHSNVDKAVSDAKAAGVQVTEKPATNTTVSADNAKAAETSIANDYANQTSAVNDATAKQVVKNESFAKDSADARSTNNANKAAIDQAVAQAKANGADVIHDEKSDKTTTATIDNYNTQKASVNKTTQDTVAKINQAGEVAKANNTVATAENDTAALTKSVDNAKNILGNDKVTQTATVNKGTVSTSNADSIAKAIRDDYNSQIANINNTVNQYQNAVSAAGAIDKSELDKAVKNAQSVLGNANVKQTDTVNKTVSVADTSKAVDEVKSDYHDQATKINKVVADYQSKLKEYKDTLATGEISTSDIYNGLHLQNEPAAKISYKVLNNKVNAEIKLGKRYTQANGEEGGFSSDTSSMLLLESVDTSNLDGDFIQVTFDNLSNSKYNEIPIKKIIATFSNAKHQTSTSEFAKAPIRLDISNNIKDGMHYYNSSEVSVSYQFYDNNGTLIDLGKDNTAWIAVKSLNAIYWKNGDARSIEEVKLDSSGTGYKLKGSPVVKHSDGFWYSDETTDSYGIAEDKLGKINQIPYGTPWDGNPDLEYMGSTLFNVTGKTVSFTYKAYDTDVAWISGANTDRFISGPWVVLSTSIMKDSSGLVAPNVSYNYSTVIACLRLHR